MTAAPMILASALTALGLFLVAAAVVDLRQWRTIRTLRVKLLAAQIITQKRDNTIDEQALMLVEMNDRNERLHRDLRALRERLPSLLTREEAQAMDAEDLADDTVVDEDPVRAYIPHYDVGYLSLSPEIQSALEKDWNDRHMGDDPS